MREMRKNEDEKRLGRILVREPRMKKRSKKGYNYTTKSLNERNKKAYDDR